MRWRRPAHDDDDPPAPLTDRGARPPGRGALVDRDDITDRVGEITCPVLIVHGTADTAIPIEKAELLRAELPDCRDLVPIEGRPTPRTSPTRPR